LKKINNETIGTTKEKPAPKEKAAPKKKAIKKVIDKPIEVTLWDAANKLRGSVEPAEYIHVVLSLIFLKLPAINLKSKGQN
jgi:type I restriction-modification system DNA methylase subunit